MASPAPGLDCRREMDDCPRERNILRTRLCENGEVSQRDAKNYVGQLRTKALVRKLLVGRFEQMRGVELLSVIQCYIRSDERRRRGEPLPRELVTSESPVDEQARAAARVQFVRRAAVAMAEERRLCAAVTKVVLHLSVECDGVVALRLRPECELSVVAAQRMHALVDESPQLGPLAEAMQRLGGEGLLAWAPRRGRLAPPHWQFSSPEQAATELMVALELRVTRWSTRKKVKR